ncbi:transcript variant X2 [Nothobranchius furzeri]|uniref:Transcript variant X2 n=1 Tax=Nothobranchius furzeri TaxID=105023 RepID=A0A9D2Y675_NOTFU|nr:transcript variant X2 [Nothobranchius furzeri]
MTSKYVKCPICGRPFAALSHHLKRSHKVVHPEERQLLLKLASKRVFYRYEACPVPGCRYHSSRCDKHLETCHPELTKEQMERVVQSVQRKVTVRWLAALRATAPHPPMVSQLDQEDDTDIWPDEDAEPQANCQGCITLQRKYEGVKLQLDNLRKTFRLYHRRVAKFERRTGSKITKNLPLPEEQVHVRPSTSRGPKQRPGGRSDAAVRRPPSKQAGEPRSGRTKERQARRRVATPSPPSSPTSSSSAPSSTSPPPSRQSPPPSPPWQLSPSPPWQLSPSPSPPPPPSPPWQLSPSPPWQLSPSPSPPPSPSRHPSKHKTPPVSLESEKRLAGSVAPSSGRREGPDSPPPAKRIHKTRHTGGSPSPEESPEESQPPRKGGKTPRQSPASLLSGFSSAMEDYLDDYRTFLRGLHQSKKHIDNVASKVMRIRRFLNFMAVGALRLWDWSFLTRTERIMEWVGHLKRCGKKVTTVTFYLRNVYSFFRYFKETPPRNCRLKGSQITAVLRSILQCISPLLRDVGMHQMKVKEAKQMRVISVADLNLCQQRCREAIPQLLERLEKEPTDHKVRYRFFGFLAAFISSIYGHRTGVISNMTVKEVTNARKKAKEDSPGFVINVFLKPDEFAWMERWLAVRQKLKPEGDLVFFGATAQPNKNLVHFLQTAWEEMGLSGKPTFTDLRTAIASHAKERHIPQVRELISAAMCHDVRTADKFYTVFLDPVKCAAMRDMFEEATSTQGSTREAPAPFDIPFTSQSVPGTVDTSGLTSQLPPRRKAQRREKTPTETASEGHVSYQESGSSESAEDEEDDNHPGQSTPVQGAQPEPIAPELTVEPSEVSSFSRHCRPDPGFSCFWLLTLKAAL